MEILKETVFRDVTLGAIREGLTESGTDDAVNAANSYLRHGGETAAIIGHFVDELTGLKGRSS